MDNDVGNWRLSASDLVSLWSPSMWQVVASNVRRICLVYGLVLGPGGSSRHLGVK